jgi:pilus assembly protein CpaB
MRRLLAAFAALLLLVVGTVVLLAYVQGADARALAGVRTVDVLVAEQPIPEGTSGDQLADLVRTEKVPAKTAVRGRVTDLSALAGTVADVDILPGEQLLSGRFVSPDARVAPDQVEVPAGLQEVSVLLEPQRAVGGRLAAGDTVGVVISQTMPDGTPATHAVLHHVLVTQVQGAPAPADPAAQEGQDPATASAGTPAPSASLMITLAVDAARAEAVVFGIEHGTLWLSLEPAGADTGGTDVLTPATIYGKAFA